MNDDINHKTYSTPGVVRYYTQLNRLQPAEETIIKLLDDQLSTMTMLDIGIGGGRTTKHFSNRVGNYIGIDYCSEMIAACKKRFSRSQVPLTLKVADARDLSQFDDNTFDFILFSFNGIDYISHRDRLTVFQEVSRIGKTGGYFFFSSHNLQGIEPAFNWRKQLSFNPMKSYINLVMGAFLRFFNRSLNYQKIKISSYAIIRDESHNFRLKTYYIRPKEQLKQLALFFNKIQMYSWKTGQEIIDKGELNTNTDMWLYYLSIFK